MPDATLARLIMPTAVAERRPDKAFTPHPAIGARCLMRRLRVLSCLQPLPNVGWIRRLRRIRQFSAPDEGAKCRVAGITDCSNHFARLRRSVWSIPRSDFRGAAAFRTGRLACCPAGDENRIHLYDHHVGLVVEQLRCITNGQSTDAAFYCALKSITPGCCRITRASRLRRAF